MEMFLSVLFYRFRLTMLNGERQKNNTPSTQWDEMPKARRGTTQISALYRKIIDDKANTSLADNGAHRVPLTRPYRRFTGQAPKGNAHNQLHVRFQPGRISL
jgi:hypothetical protein